MVKRGVIVAKIKPGSAEKVAEIFRESDDTDLPKLAGVRHRSLFILEDIYIHLVEMDEDFDQCGGGVRDHPPVPGDQQEARALHPALQPGHLELTEGRDRPRVLQLGRPYQEARRSGGARVSEELRRSQP